MANFEFAKGASGKDLSIRIGVPKFDAACVREFKEQLDGVWTEDLREVTVDFSEVEFIDSSGIGALLSIQKRLPKDGEKVVIVNAHPNVASIIELLRLDRVFRVEIGI